MPKLTRVHKVLIGTVATGAVIIAGIGFAGSYAAVRELALQKGFGNFSYAFPIGVDAGIVVLLALDLLLTWIRIPFPLLRQTAWLLTVATIAFNGAAAWPDPLGVGMHAVIPVLFVVAVEAARHAVGRIADITADKHMEGVRLTRWLLSPGPTFLLWRRMKLWELRSYDEVIKREQERLVYQARLRQRFGRAWRRKAPVEALMPLRLARYGVPLEETASAGLAAANITVPTAELERLDGDDVREELAPTSSVRELEPVQVDVDPTEHHGQDEGADTAAADEAAGHPEPGPELQPAPEPYEAYGPGPEASYLGAEYGSYGTGPLASAPVPVAARGEGRPRVVQARIDGPEWGVDQLADEALGQSPIGDGQGGPFVPGQATEPELPVYETTDEDEGQDEAADEVDEGAEPEPNLSGKELLEYRYLQLPPELRYPHTSASALAREWHEAAGFTVDSARKYLGEIIRKHR
ncbi:DUF2637 domain-containing protein [Streptomyces sp. DSM 41014]|uniref:DUF2637 domain-containing protein n=2 Tax=Streptomyces TaxID=1883 RepID=A0ABU2UXL6_9ACTN|nr:DUF2637 domain-containing protein [Streptomyces sp. DSM 41014]MDT0478031.1 DUF2637 domain-containing protein [Streptomyces sp. DSM 41014]